MKKRDYYNGIWDVVCKRDGKEIWKEHIHNDLLDMGERLMLDVFFQGETLDSFYVRLSTATFDEDVNIATALAAEPAAANGYTFDGCPLARTPVGWPTKSTINGNALIQSATITVTATGGAINDLVGAWLADGGGTDAGTNVIAFAPFSMERDLADGDSLEFTLQVSLA